MAIATTNPATGETVERFTPLDADEIDARIARAATAYRDYRRTTFADRAGWMHAAADIVDSQQDDIARLITLEMGKPIKQAAAEVGKCATAMRHYADNAEKFLADQPADAKAVSARDAYVRWQPIGPVLAIMPGHLPFWH